MLKIIDIEKCYENFTLKIPELKIEEGESVALVGPNGAGKSTLLKLIMGIIKPDIGDIIIKSKDKNKPTVGFVSIDTNLYEHMSIIDYLIFFGKMYGISEVRIKSKINELVSILSVDKNLNTKIQNLSTGNKQKVALIKGLIHDPEILILDEPTNGLDIVTSSDVRKLIKEEQAKGKTTIICSHLEEDLKLSSRLLILDKGVIMLDTSDEELSYKNNIYDIYFSITKPNFINEVR